MASVHQSGWRYLKGMSIALLCLLELPRAWAQRAEGEQQLLVLDAKKATGLLLKQVPPEYPALAKVNYIQGRVRVRLVVSAAGAVVGAHVLSGNPLLAAAVLDRVRMWRYRPYAAEGGSTSFATVVDVNFTLRIKKMDLAPAQAESDFRRQVKPPEVLAGPEEIASTDPSVRLRLLVNAEGKVIDSEILKGIPSLFEGARKSIERWSFRPARWGALSVPWYLEVDVPVYNAPSQAGTRSPSGR
ncbi:MAG: TonB family protein [Terriglobia bacterium]